MPAFAAFSLDGVDRTVGVNRVTPAKYDPLKVQEVDVREPLFLTVSKDESGTVSTGVSDGSEPDEEDWVAEAIKMEKQLSADQHQLGVRSAICNVVLVWVRAGDLARAEAWLRYLSNAGYFLPRGFCRHVVQRLLNKDGCFTTSAASASEWLMNLAPLGVVVDRATVNRLLGVFARQGEYDWALKWADYIKKQDMTPNQSTYQLLHMGAVNANRHDWAAHWQRVMNVKGIDAGQEEICPPADLSLTSLSLGGSEIPPSGKMGSRNFSKASWKSASTTTIGAGDSEGSNDDLEPAFIDPSGLFVQPKRNDAHLLSAGRAASKPITQGEQKTAVFDRNTVSDKLKEAEAYGTEAALEPRFARTPWRQRLWVALSQESMPLVAKLGIIESAVGFRDGTTPHRTIKCLVQSEDVQQHVQQLILHGRTVWGMAKQVLLHEAQTPLMWTRGDVKRQLQQQRRTLLLDVSEVLRDAGSPLAEEVSKAELLEEAAAASAAPLATPLLDPYCAMGAVLVMLRLMPQHMGAVVDELVHDPVVGSVDTSVQGGSPARSRLGTADSYVFPVPK